MRQEKDHTPSYSPVKQSSIHNVAVAIRGKSDEHQTKPKVVASGRGSVAREIVDIAYKNGIHVREDCALAEILAQLDLDTPIPPEAIIAVTEILAKVYEANNSMINATNSLQDNPFAGLDTLR